MKTEIFKKKATLPEFNMMALMDIIFLVLIFCIIAMAKMVILEVVDVKNPELKNARNMDPQDFVSITITKNGDLFVNKAPIASKKVLTTWLKEKISCSKSGNLTVIINGDKSVDLGIALNLLETVRMAGCEKVYFKSEKEK